MKKSWKNKIAKITGPNRELNRKALKMKSSWDEVAKILNSTVKSKKKK